MERTTEVDRPMLASPVASGDRPLPFADLGGSGQQHVARDAEAILAREWPIEVAGTLRPSGRATGLPSTSSRPDPSYALKHPWP